MCEFMCTASVFVFACVCWEWVGCSYVWPSHMWVDCELRKKKSEIIYGMQKPTAHVPLREPECIKVIKYFWCVLNALFIKKTISHAHCLHISSIICFRKNKLKQIDNVENNQPTMQCYSTANLLKTLSWHFTNILIILFLALEGHKVPARLSSLLGSMQIQFPAKKLLKPSNWKLYWLAPYLSLPFRINLYHHSCLPNRINFEP